MTTKVMASPYLSPVYEYATAKMIGQYIPYDFPPKIYLNMLTIVATIVIDTKSSNVC